MNKFVLSIATSGLMVFALHTGESLANENRAPDPEEFKKIIRNYSDSGKLPAVQQRQQPKSVEQFNRALSLHTKKNASNNELKEAAVLYQAASDAGLAPATTNLALMYIDGKGVKKDVKKAITLLNAASKLNESQADVLLARLYLNGIDVKQDQKKGESLLNKAIKAGNQNAVKMLAEYKEWKKKNEIVMKQFQEQMKKAQLSKPAQPAQTITIPANNQIQQFKDLPLLPGYNYLKENPPFTYPLNNRPQTQPIKITAEPQPFKLEEAISSIKSKPIEKPLQVIDLQKK